MDKMQFFFASIGGYGACLREGYVARRGTSDRDRSDDARGEGRDRAILHLKDNIFQSSILCNVHYYSQMIKSHFVFFAELKLQF
jgi:hypothetical protein